MNTAIGLYSVLLCALAGLCRAHFRIDTVALGALAYLGITGLLPETALFMGFSSMPVMALIAIMMISRALEKAGIIQWGVEWLIRCSQEKEWIIYGGFLLAAGLLPAAIQSFGTVALLLPAAHLIALRIQIPLQQLLIPMCFCALLGSNLTMTGSGALLLANHTAHLPIWAPAPIGMMGLGFGLIYCWINRTRLFADQYADPHARQWRHYETVYGIAYHLHEYQLDDNSPWIGHSVAEIEAELPPGMACVACQTSGLNWFPARRKAKLGPGARLAIMGPANGVAAWARHQALIPIPGIPTFSHLLNPAVSGLCEALIPPGSALVGTRYTALHVRRKHDLQLLAIRRNRQIRLGARIRKTRLKAGDTLVLHGTWIAMRDFQRPTQVIWLHGNFPKLYPLSSQWPVALAALVTAGGLVGSGLISPGLGLFVAAVLLIATGVLEIDEAYQAIHWRSIFLLACLIPLGHAAQTTGAARLAADHLVSWVDGWPLFAILLLVAGITTLLSQLLSNLGASALLLPLGQELAHHVGQPAAPFLLLIGIAANNVFTATTHQANQLVMGAGHYTPQDFMRTGLPIALFFWLMSTTVVYSTASWWQ